MPVDFFATPCANPAGNCTGYPLPCLTNIPNQQFGITDEDGGNSTPARVDATDPTIWDLTVTNNSGVNVCFKAVDWCVSIYRTGTYNLDDVTRTNTQFSSDNIDKINRGLIKRCEGFLQFDNKILFIEVKNWRKAKGGWVRDAREKFEETILSFREHHPRLAGQVIEPILSNPSFHGLHPNDMVQKRILKDKIGLEFKRQNSIII